MNEDSYQELARLREQVTKQEKLASLGMLTAGIAHEIQNPLNFVINFSKMSSKLMEDLEDIVSEVSGSLSEDDREELGEIIGKPLGDLDLTAIENMVDAGSAVLKSEAYTTSDGYLNVLVTQREPAVRFQGGTGGFYADRNGYVFPLQRNYTSDVPVIDGYIPVKIPAGYKGKVPDETGRKWLQDILDMTGFMDRSRVWARNIVQISVQEDGDIIMIPREGKEKFIFGSPEGFEEKFGRMEKYYTAVKPSKEEGYYSSVNVKYEGQIICRR